MSHDRVAENHEMKNVAKAIADKTPDFDTRVVLATNASGAQYMMYGLLFNTAAERRAFTEQALNFTANETQRVQDLLEANNRYLERARVAEHRNKEALKLLQEWFEQEAGDDSILKITQARNILRGE